MYGKWYNDRYLIRKNHKFLFISKFNNFLQILPGKYVSCKKIHNTNILKQYLQHIQLFCYCAEKEKKIGHRNIVLI